MDSSACYLSVGQKSVTMQPHLGAALKGSRGEKPQQQGQGFGQYYSASNFVERLVAQNKDIHKCMGSGEWLGTLFRGM